MRFHVCSLPHTNTTQAFGACAYTNKVRLFCRMMKDRGHTVYLYAGEENEAPCDEVISCISEKERALAVGQGHYCHAPFDVNLPHWRHFNHRASIAIKRRAQPKDFICLIAGACQKPISDALPQMMAVEFGVGYSGTFANYRVFESYAWMHAVYAMQQGNAHDADGHWFDDVIPGYLDRSQFPFREKKQDYYCFVGRLTERKGFRIAADVCQAANARLLIAGQGFPPSYGEYLGVVGPQERGELMANATACFVPTIYLEPFGNVAVEAMACGTPVITTDWGAFTETVIQGKTGYRCRSFAQFLDAMEDVKGLDPHVIRDHALNNYSLEAIAPRYEAYFQRLGTLWGEGWYSLERYRDAALDDRNGPSVAAIAGGRV